jgi:hypothetical protein
MSVNDSSEPVPLFTVTRDRSRLRTAAMAVAGYR